MNDIRNKLRIRAVTNQFEDEHKKDNDPLQDDNPIKMRKLLSDKNISKHVDRFNFSPIPLCPRAYKELPPQELNKI